MSVANDLVILTAVRTTQRTSTASAPPDGGAIDGQSDAAAGFKSLIPFGLPQDLRQRVPHGIRI